MISLLVAVMVMFSTSAKAEEDPNNPSVPVKRIIQGAEGMSVIRAFSNWHNVTPNPSLRHVEKFNSWDGSWEPVPVEDQERLEGIYRMEFIYTNGYEFHGFVGANDGGTGFQTISLDSLLNNFTEDPVKLLRKIKKIAKENGTKNHFLTVWMAYSTEGLSVSDAGYHWEGTEYKVIAILPCNGNGYVDINNISRGYRGISLSDEVPHFLILKPRY